MGVITLLGGMERPYVCVSVRVCVEGDHALRRDGGHLCMCGEETMSLVETKRPCVYVWRGDNAPWRDGAPLCVCGGGIMSLGEMERPVCIWREFVSPRRDGAPLCTSGGGSCPQEKQCTAVLVIRALEKGIGWFKLLAEMESACV